MVLEQLAFGFAPLVNAAEEPAIQCDACDFSVAFPEKHKLEILAEQLDKQLDNTALAQEYVEQFGKTYTAYRAVKGGQTIDNKTCLLLLGPEDKKENDAYKAALEAKDDDSGATIKELKSAMIKRLATKVVFKEIRTLIDYPNTLANDTEFETKSTDPAHNVRLNNSPHGIYTKALIQLIGESELIKNDAALLRQKSYELAYAQNYSKVYVAERAPNIPEAAQKIYEMKRAQMRETPGSYDVTIVHLERFIAGMSGIAKTIETAIDEGENIDDLFAGNNVSPEVEQAMLNHSIPNNLKMLYEAYINNNPLLMQSARANILMNAAVDMEEDLTFYWATDPAKDKYTPLLLKLPDVAIQLYDVLIKSYPDTEAAELAQHELFIKNNQRYATIGAGSVLGVGLLATALYWMTVGEAAAMVSLEVADWKLGVGHALFEQSAGRAKYWAWELIGKGGFTVVVGNAEKAGLRTLFKGATSKAEQALLARGLMGTQAGFTRHAVYSRAGAMALPDIKAIVGGWLSKVGIGKGAAKAAAIVDKAVVGDAFDEFQKSWLRGVAKMMEKYTGGKMNKLSIPLSDFAKREARKLYAKLNPSIVMDYQSVETILRTGAVHKKLGFASAGHSIPYAGFRGVGGVDSGYYSIVILKNNVRKIPGTSVIASDAGLLMQHEFNPAYFHLQGVISGRTVGGEDVAEEYALRLINDIVKRYRKLNDETVRRYLMEVGDGRFIFPEMQIPGLTTAVDDIEAILVPHEEYLWHMANPDADPKMLAKLIDYEVVWRLDKGDVGKAYYNYTDVSITIGKNVVVDIIKTISDAQTLTELKQILAFYYKDGLVDVKGRKYSLKELLASIDQAHLEWNETKGIFDASKITDADGLRDKLLELLPRY